MTVPPLFQTFRLWRNATFSEPIILKNPDLTLMDLTGWEADCVITREDGTALYHLTTTPSAGLVIDGPAGEVTMTIDAPQVGVTIDTSVPVDADGEMWPFVLTLTNPSPTPDYVERLVQGYVIAYA